MGGSGRVGEEPGLTPAPSSPYSRHVTWGPLRAGRLSVKYRKPSDINLTEGSRRAAVHQRKFDPSRPGNARKLEVVGELTKLADESGLKLARPAIAFVRAHPAATSVIIGPRTPAQLEDLLEGVGVELSDGVLDRIEEIVPPGTDLNRDDSYCTPPAPADKPLRRRR